MAHLRRSIHLFGILVVLALVACAARVAERRTADGQLQASGMLAGTRQTGTWTYYHADGTKRAEGQYHDDMQTGHWTWWHPGGAVEQMGEYGAGGLRAGLWHFKHADGAPLAEGTYFADRQDGPWRWWRADGSRLSQGYFRSGARTGMWTVWLPDGAIVEQGLYADGRKVGPWLEREAGAYQWIERGIPEGAEVYREPREGPPRRWGLLRDQRPSGLWAVWDGSGRARLWALRDQATDSLWPLDADGQAIEKGEVETIQRLGAPLVEAVVVRPPASAPPRSPLPEPKPSEFGMVPLSPLPVLPGLFTERELANVSALVTTYTTGKPVGDTYWGDAPAAGGIVAAAARLRGRPLPQTRLLGADGSVIDLGECVGKERCLVVILRGFSGQVCIYCTTQTAALVDNLARFTAANTRVVLLYPGPAEAVPVFLEAVAALGREIPAGLTIAIDPDLTLVKGLGIEGTLAKPTALIVDRNGSIGWAYVGASKGDRPSVDRLIEAAEKLP